MRFAPQQIGIESDGEFTLRFLRADGSLSQQYMASIGDAYIIAQRPFYHFRLAPLAGFYIRFGLDDRRLNDKTTPRLPKGYDDRFAVDLSSMSFVDAFFQTTVRMLRLTERPERKDNVRKLLREFEVANLPDLLGQWNQG